MRLGRGDFRGRVGPVDPPAADAGVSYSAFLVVRLGKYEKGTLFSNDFETIVFLAVWQVLAHFVNFGVHKHAVKIA